MVTETLPFDAAEYLKDPDDQRELLMDAFASGDATFIKTALGTVARARGMASVARDSGVSREALYKALSAGGDPRLSTLLGVIKALGLEIRACPAGAE